MSDHDIKMILVFGVIYFAFRAIRDVFNGAFSFFRPTKQEKPKDTPKLWIPVLTLLAIAVWAYTCYLIWAYCGPALPPPETKGLRASIPGISLRAAAPPVSLSGQGDQTTGNAISDLPETVFTPEDSGSKYYLELLDKARRSVDIAIYAFTDRRISSKLAALKRRGVQVRALLDGRQSQLPREVDVISDLKQAGIEYLECTSGSGSIMHDKYTIVDDEWVESGSWNYTIDADRQDNFLDFSRSPARVCLFRKNWDKMYSSMKMR